MDDIDDAVIESVRQVVSDVGQPGKVATRLLRWMNSLSRGESSLDDRAEVEDRLSAIFNAMNIDTNHNEN